MHNKYVNSFQQIEKKFLNLKNNIKNRKHIYSGFQKKQKEIKKKNNHRFLIVKQIILN